MIALTTLVCTLSADPSFDECMTQIRKHRESLESGSVVFQTTYIKFGSNTPMPDTWRVTWSGEKVRSYRKHKGILTFQTTGTKSDHAGVLLSIICKGGLPGDTTLCYTPDPLGEHRVAVDLYSSEYEPKLRTFVPYTRWLGCLPSDSLGAVHINPEEFFDPENASEARCTKEMVNGVEVLHLKWSKQGKNVVSYEATVVPSRDYAVDRVYSRWTAYGVSYSHEVSCKWKQYSDRPAAPWYPDSYEFERTEAGKVVVRERMQVVSADLNIPIPNRAFTLAELEDIEPNTPIGWVSDQPPPAKGQLVWDGSKIVGNE